MEKRQYYVVLYDFYGNLLNEKQQQYFEYYYFDNLSLQEISEELNVSRNAIHKSLKIIEDKLEFYEDKLKLYQKQQHLNLILEKIEDNNIKEQIKKLN